MRNTKNNRLIGDFETFKIEIAYAYQNEKFPCVYLAKTYNCNLKRMQNLVSRFKLPLKDYREIYYDSLKSKFEYAYDNERRPRKYLKDTLHLHDKTIEKLIDKFEIKKGGRLKKIKDIFVYAYQNKRFPRKWIKENIGFDIPDSTLYFYKKKFKLSARKKYDYSVLDKYIIEAYKTKKCPVRYLKKKFPEVGSRSIESRAKKLGVNIRVFVRWSDKEKAIIIKNGYKPASKIKRILAQAGYKRTIAAINTQKQIICRRSYDVYSTGDVAQCLGVCIDNVRLWISKEYLKDQQESSGRRWIKPKDVKDFLINHINVIDIRFVDKYWLIDILTTTDFSK